MDVVADERVTREEAAALEEVARANGLTQDTLIELHQKAFKDIVGVDFTKPATELSSVRRRELLSLAKALDVASVVALLAPLVEAD